MSLSLPSSPPSRRSRIYEIHSKKYQVGCDNASNASRNNTYGAAVLVISDVSARGVYYPGVTCVIQVGVPTGRKQYIHRVGRTGHAGHDGRGDIVILPWEHKFIPTTLPDVPIRSLSVAELEEQTSALAEKHD
jgi:ATP-dependent RNA helicase MSS116, mitochondrial